MLFILSSRLAVIGYNPTSMEYTLSILYVPTVPAGDLDLDVDLDTFLAAGDVDLRLPGDPHVLPGDRGLSSGDLDLAEDSHWLSEDLYPVLPTEAFFSVCIAADVPWLTSCTPRGLHGDEHLL